MSAPVTRRPTVNAIELGFEAANAGSPFSRGRLQDRPGGTNSSASERRRGPSIR
jgi:hypothetical protein